MDAADEDGAPRRYHSPVRDARAEQRRANVFAVAHDLFVERGWAATTVAEIAERSGVSPQLIFSAMGGKPGLIIGALRQRSFGGPELRTALSTVPFEQRSTVGARLDLLAEFSAPAVSAMAPILSVLWVAADADAEAERRLDELNQGRRKTCLELLPRLLGRRPRNARYLADELFVLTSGETYLQFSRVSSWSDKRYAGWLRSALREAFTRYGVDLESPVVQR